MAADGGLPPGSVAAELFEAPYRFDFFQAVRVLQALRPAPGSAPAGAGGEPSAEPVRFRSHVGLGFPPNDVVAVDADGDGGPPAMTVAFMGLAGVQGPMPRAFTEEVMHHARAGDTAARDFLDLFNHRLVGLMYRARARHSPALELNPADQSWLARYLFSLMGLGTPGLTRAASAPAGLHVPRRALLGYAALLSTETRSAVGLERILSDHFGVDARVVPFTGGWVRLEDEDLTRIGASGQNRTLGRDVVLGGRVWDAEGAFTVRVGPLGLGQYVRFLPHGTAFAALCSLARFYAGIDLEFTVSLVLRADEVPPSRLGTRAGARLGWTSWLRTRPYGPTDAEVRLDPAHHGADLPFG
jgi:type VI secretion system protein ImpH